MTYIYILIYVYYIHRLHFDLSSSPRSTAPLPELDEQVRFRGASQFLALRKWFPRKQKPPLIP